MTLLSKLLSLPIHFYRWFLSPLLMPCCRFFPTCSTYALQALASHGAVYGLWLIVRRLCRCHPWGGSGYDPVPLTKQEKNSFSLFLKKK